MSERVKGLVVTFKKPLTREDADSYISAISLLLGVVDVAPVDDNCADHINRAIIRNELIDKLWNVVFSDGPQP